MLASFIFPQENEPRRGITSASSSPADRKGIQLTVNVTRSHTSAVHSVGEMHTAENLQMCAIMSVNKLSIYKK